MIKKDVSIQPNISELITERNKIKESKPTGIVGMINKEKKLLELDRKIANSDPIKREK